MISIKWLSSILEEKCVPFLFDVGDRINPISVLKNYSRTRASVLQLTSFVLPFSLLIFPFSAANAQSLNNLAPSLELTSIGPNIVSSGGIQPPQSPDSSLLKPSKVAANLDLLADRFLNDGTLPVGTTVTDGAVVIEAISSRSGEALLDDLTDIGLENGAVFGKLVSGTLPLSALGEAEALDSLQFIRLALPIRRAGSVDNQADIAMQSDIVRSTYGLDGDGITIGILSDSYNQLGGEAADIASGDLPSGVIILDDTGAGSNIDEGRAMAQLIHDIVPGAQLMFRTAFNGAPDFAQGIIDLRDAGADVIVDDIGYLNEPFFQDGVVAQAVDQVVADGAVYFSSAGNSYNNSYEADYVDSGLTTSDLALTGTPYELSRLHDFVPGNPAQLFQIADGDVLQLSLQWDQPFASTGGAGSASDVDVFLYDLTTGAFVTGSGNSNIGGDASEIFSYQNSTGATQNLVIVVGIDESVGGGQPTPGKVKWINYGSPVPHNPFTGSSTVVGHPNSEGAIAVGAARYDNTPPYGVNPPLIENFSSYGGTEVLFDTAGVLLPSPVDRNKPELVAPDGSDTTFFGSTDFDGSGHPDFFGTSAAAPHAAAIAVLQLECNPAMVPSVIQAQQLGSAIDMNTPGFDNISGDGLIDAVGVLDFNLCDDIYEEDDSFATASTIVEGVPQTGHNINDGGTDIDFVTFNLTCEADVVIETSGPGGSDDTYLELFDSSQVLIDSNDDFNGLYSQITATLLAGTYYAAVTDLSGFTDIADYTLSYDRTCVSGGLTCNGKTVTVDFNLGQTTTTDDDVVMGTPGDDDIRGKAGNDTICGMGGDDFIHGNSGDDWIDGGDGVDNLKGGQGDDIIYTGTGSTVGTGSKAFGGYGEDIIIGGPDDDDLRGGKAYDDISGNGGNDEIFGNDDDDLLSGGPGSDIIKGGQGENDQLFGDGGADELNGGSGSNDTCDGGGQAGDTEVNCEN